jgi:uncharacterized protein YigA (DUF484 family)
MNQVHRACLAVLEPNDFAAFLRVLTRDVAMILGVEVIRLGLEAPAAAPGQPLGPAGPLRNVVVALPAGGVEAYVTRGRGLGARKVTLRRVDPAPDDLYGADADAVRSEALLRLDLGMGNLGGLLAFGASDPRRFHPDQGVDLLTFFAAVFERSLRPLAGVTGAEALLGVGSRSSAPCGGRARGRSPPTGATWRGSWGSCPGIGAGRWARRGSGR